MLTEDETKGPQAAWPMGECVLQRDGAEKGKRVERLLRRDLTQENLLMQTKVPSSWRRNCYADPFIRPGA
jgi:hypothetical protein